MFESRHRPEAAQPGRLLQREGRSPLQLEDRYGGQGLGRKQGFASADTFLRTSWAYTGLELPLVKQGQCTHRCAFKGNVVWVPRSQYRQKVLPHRCKKFPPSIHLTAELPQVCQPCTQSRRVLEKRFTQLQHDKYATATKSQKLHTHTRLSRMHVCSCRGSQKPQKVPDT